MPKMTNEEKAKRIRELEIHYGLHSHTVERMAQRDQLPSNPHFAEWLILLGRGDLIDNIKREPKPKLLVLVYEIREGEEWANNKRVITIAAAQGLVDAGYLARIIDAPRD